MEEYFLRSQNTVKQYIATHLVMDIYREAVRRTGARVYNRWWEQEGLELKGSRVDIKAEADGDPEEADEEAEGVAGN